MSSTSDAPVPLPTVKLIEIRPGISLLQPLSRKGHGPGMIILSSASSSTGVALKEGVPSNLMKWAEEGYTVVEICASACNDSHESLGLALKELSDCAVCQPKDKVGLVSYDPELFSKFAPKLSEYPIIQGVVVYSDVLTSTLATDVSVPVLQHFAGPAKKDSPPRADCKMYYYPETESFLFATPFQKKFKNSSEAVSHTRNLTFLKNRMNGPYFDLEAIWEEHTYYEFEARSVPHTMATMVQEPYVNHVPTLTGGIGREKLSDFYSNHFVFQNPKDTEMELISRTIGIDRVIDEFLYKFTHDMQIDWLLPGVPPTGRKIELPFTAVVNVRGDRLYHEHIAWDQASALVQLGLMPYYLPYPYALPDGRKPAPGKKFEYRVPAAGKETAAKMRDKNGVISNQMFEYEIREVDA